MKKLLIGLMLLVVLAAGIVAADTAKPTPTAKATPTQTLTATEVPSATATEVPATDTSTPTVSPTATPPTATVSSSPTLLPTSPSGEIAPFLGAPLCAHPSNSEFHTLWNTSGCHYDHEHGTDPFTSQVASAFPGFDLFSLLGNVEVGHTNLSSPMENTMKHGGFKWDVVLSIPCPDPAFPGGFEGAQNCVSAIVVQYHNFGRYELEMETRNHTTAALVKACRDGDCGFLYTTQFQEYGQRVTPYQGTILPYPDNFLPLYPSPRGPYFTTDCAGPDLPGCRVSVAAIRSGNLNANSIWTSKPTGSGARPQTSSLFRLLFRVRDTYQVLDASDQTHPFTWPFVCGPVFNPAGCRYNNSTSKVHEVAGDIPVAWDSLDGVVDGRVTYEGFTTRFGTLAPACTEPGVDCHPVNLVNFPVGSYGGALPGQKISNPSPVSNPERDIYFCGAVVCSETSPGAVPSGWISTEN